MKFSRTLAVAVIFTLRAFCGHAQSGAGTTQVGSKEKYLVVFSEWYHSATNAVDRKYRAGVVVYKLDLTSPYAEWVQVGDILRGSTFPSEYWYPTNSAKKTNETLFADGTLQAIIKTLRGEAYTNLGLYGFESLEALSFESRYWPIIVSGTNYSFQVSNRNAATREHFAPRALLINDGGFVQTVNPNDHWGSRYVADGIWIHRGRRGGANRDSEGCLTIHPDDWTKFLALLPDEKAWKTNGGTGTLQITREFESGKLPPAPHNPLAPDRYAPVVN